MGIDRSVSLPPDLLEIKAASRALVRAYGGQLAAAKRLKTSQQRVSDCCSRDKDVFLRLDQVATLEAETNGPDHPHVTTVLARLHDLELVELSPCAASGRDLLRLFAKQSRSCGELAQKILDAHADNIVTPDEAKLIEQAADEVISIAIHIRAEAQMIQKEY